MQDRHFWHFPCGFTVVSINSRLHIVLHINPFQFIRLVPGTFCFALHLGRNAQHWRLIRNDTGFIQTHETPLGYRWHAPRVQTTRLSGTDAVLLFVIQEIKGGTEREDGCGCMIIHLSFCLKSQKHPTGIALSSDWSGNIYHAQTKLWEVLHLSLILFTRVCVGGGVSVQVVSVEVGLCPGGISAQGGFCPEESLRIFQLDFLRTCRQAF